MACFVSVFPLCYERLGQPLPHLGYRLHHEQKFFVFSTVPQSAIIKQTFAPFFAELLAEFSFFFIFYYNV